MRLAVFLSLVLASCAPNLSEVPVVRWPKIVGPLALPVLVEVEAGEEIPVELALGGDLLEQTSLTTVTLVAKRRFFLWLREDGPPRISLDGESVAEGGRGRLSVGLEKRSAEEPKITVSVDQSFPEP
jgi:hypothetical protein